MGKWTAAQMPDLKGKVAVVTGANSGLGYYTALELGRHGAQVQLACRSRDKTEAAMAQMRQAAPGAQLEYVGLDLADLDSVRACAAELRSRFRQVDLLLNNAGVMALPLARTRQGFEMQFGTNHLGHFALTGLLLERLQATPGARVVNTASMAHRWTRGMDFADPNWEKKRYRKWDAYGKTKLANLLFTYEMNRRLAKAGSGLTVVAAHPGYAATNLQLAGPAMEQSALGGVVMKVANALFGQPAEMGALPQLYAATAPEVRGGEYYGPDGPGQNRGYPKRVGSNTASRDEAAARELWALSERLTGVSFLSS
jgi:NAD(P)-dependent dehydrogenase (short-subunit alcohol dehydrogenase family)